MTIAEQVRTIAETQAGQPVNETMSAFSREQAALARPSSSSGSTWRP